MELIEKILEPISTAVGYVVAFVAYEFFFSLIILFFCSKFYGLIMRLFKKDFIPENTDKKLIGLPLTFALTIFLLTIISSVFAYFQWNTFHDIYVITAKSMGFLFEAIIIIMIPILLLTGLFNLLSKK